MHEDNEVYKFIIKAITPAFIAVSIALAIKAKTQKLTTKRVIISYVAGVGVAYFAYPFINNDSFGNYTGGIIGVLAITSEKIMEFLLYRLNVDNMLGAFVEALKDMVVKLINPNSKN